MTTLTIWSFIAVLHFSPAQQSSLNINGIESRARCAQIATEVAELLPSTGVLKYRCIPVRLPAGRSL